MSLDQQRFEAGLDYDFPFLPVLGIDFTHKRYIRYSLSTPMVLPHADNALKVLSSEMDPAEIRLIR